MQMPVMNGLEATEEIRKNINRKIPIIALTANAIKGESDKCLEAGMNDFLSKPFTEEELIGKLSMWLTRSGQKQGEAVAAEEEGALYDLSKLYEISRGNEGFVKKMLTLFCQQGPATVKQISESYNRLDFDKIKADAHRLKPSIDNLGISRLRNEIREIEKLAIDRERSPRFEYLVNYLEKTVLEVTDAFEKRP